jgi:hypothetical protein
VAIHYLNLERITALKPETHAPLIVNTDTPLPRTITRKPLQTIPRRHPLRIDVLYLMQLSQLAPCHLPDFRRKATHLFIGKQRSSFFIGERFNHGASHNDDR